MNKYASNSLIPAVQARVSSYLFSLDPLRFLFVLE